VGVLFAVGIPTLVAFVSVPAGRSALPAILGGYVRAGGNLSGPLGLEGTAAVSLSQTTSVVILAGADLGLSWDLLGGPRYVAGGALGSVVVTSPNRLRVKAFIGYRTYNFSELDANQGNDVIKSETYSKGSYLAPGGGLVYSRALFEGVYAEIESGLGRALFFSKSPLKVTEVSIRLGAGVEL